MPAAELKRVTTASLSDDSYHGGFASLPDTSQCFEAWLDSLRPAAKPTAPVSQFNFEGTLRLDCKVTGAVHSVSGTLIVSESAEVEADVVVATAIIEGLVRGQIRATERVKLGSKARVIGNIETPMLAIQPGAMFAGQCNYLPPLRKGEDAERASADDSLVPKASPRGTRSRPAKHEDPEAMALAAAR